MKSTLLFIMLALALAIPAAYAKEGSDQYPYGAENWYTGDVPPPGQYFVNYFGYYTGELRDGSGNKVNMGGSTPSVNATFDALRLIEVTPWKLLGANWAVHVIVPLVDQSVDMAPLGGSASKAGLGDIVVDPLILGWHGENWHAAAAFDIDLPTGYYNQNDPRVSIGAHYASFEPIFGVTFFPIATWETSAKLMYNTKTTNTATNYHSGDEFHMDYVVGKHIGHWSVGASGYFLEQLTNDTQNGQVVQMEPGFWTLGRKGQAFAAGPSVTYATKKHMEFIFQYQHEMLVQNRFSGDKLWFKMIIPL
jgi:hypothetical protein